MGTMRFRSKPGTLEDELRHVEQRLEDAERDRQRAAKEHEAATAALTEAEQAVAESFYGSSDPHEAERARAEAERRVVEAKRLRDDAERRAEHGKARVKELRDQITQRDADAVRERIRALHARLHREELAVEVTRSAIASAEDELEEIKFGPITDADVRVATERFEKWGEVPTRAALRERVEREAAARRSRRAAAQEAEIEAYLAAGHAVRIPRAGEPPVRLPPSDEFNWAS